MRRTLAPGLVFFAMLAGTSLAACQLLLGTKDLDFSKGGTGGTSSSSATTSSTGGGGSSSSGMAGSGGMDGGTPDADAGDASDGAVERGVWSVSAPDPTNGVIVTSIAVGPSVNSQPGNVFVTGAGDPFMGHPGLCTGLITEVDPDAGAGPGPGYLVELDGSTGACVWGLLFGAGAQGTGVAVDPNGNIALTGSFTNNAYLEGPFTGMTPMPAWPPLAMSGNTNSFVAVFGSDHALKWAQEINNVGMTAGTEVTTGVAFNGAYVAVAGHYMGSLAVSPPPMGPNATMITSTSDTEDAFVIWFKADQSTEDDIEVTGFLQAATGVALDPTTNDVTTVGTTAGQTIFNGQGPGVTAPAANTIFVMTYSSGKTSRFQNIFGGGQKQISPSVAYDNAHDIVVGGVFTGMVSPDGDAGTSYTATGSNMSVLVARYVGMSGMPLASLAFGSTTPGNASIAGVAPYNGLNMTFAGSFSGMAQLMTATGTTTLPSVGSHPNVYVAQMSADLSKAQWIEAYGDGTAAQVVDAIAVDPTTGQILIAGTYQGTLAFGGMGSPLTNNSGSDQLFVAKLSP